jgi:hypothetical protein
MMKKIVIFWIFIVPALSKAQWQVTSGPLGQGANVSCLLANDSDLYAGTQEEIHYTTDKGSTWILDSAGFNCPPNVTKGVSDLIRIGNSIMAVQGNNIHRSSIGSHYWLKVGVLNGGTHPNLAVIGNILFAGIWGGVYMSTDSGANWTAVDNGLTNDNINVLIANGSNLYAGSAGSGVYFSNDSGTTWTSIGLDTLGIISLACNGNNLYASSYGWNNGLFLSTDNGVNWTDITIGLNSYQRWINAIAITGNHLFIGTAGEGVLVSNNNGGSWTSINTGLTEDLISSLAIIGDNLFAGTLSRVFKSKISEIINVEEHLSKSFSMGIYPNPAHNTFAISFNGLSSKVDGHLTIYDVMGRAVHAQIISQKSEIINTRLSPGIYFIKVRAGEKEFTEKLVVE